MISLRAVALSVLALASACGGTRAPASAAATPTFSPCAGTYEAEQLVAISSATAEAVIHYTLDGSPPTTDSARYTGPIVIAASTEVRAIAIASGYSGSAVASASYVIEPPASAPTFSPAPGTYSGPQVVTITSPTPGAVVRYTLDGSAPTPSSDEYTGPISIDASTLVHAVAVAPGRSASAVTTAAYVIEPPASAPTFSPPPGTYPGPAQSITISSETPNAIVYFTLDGSPPTPQSSRYAGAIRLTSSAEIRAVAIASGHTESAVTTASYVITPVPAGAPTFSLSPGVYPNEQVVTISSATPGALVHYTLDGTTPTLSSLRYNGAIWIPATTTIRAMATAPGYLPSQEASASYAIDREVLDPPRAYHVDSANGDDGNPGTRARPLRTIGAMLARSPPAGSTIWLARGSSWREMIYTAGWVGLPGGLRDGTSVLAYGAGPLPVLDGADVIPSASWTKTPGRVNVHQATIDTSVVGYGWNGMGMRIWEDWRGGAAGRLTYVPDLASCDSTPGSWTGPQRPSHGKDTIYVHASDSSDPSRSGHVYEWPARPWGLQAGQYPTDVHKLRMVRGVKTQRHGHHDGGIITTTYLGDFEVDPGGAGPVDPSHGLWCNGTCEDGITSTTVSYGNDLPGATYRRVFVNCSSPTGVAPTSTGTGFFFHTGGLGLRKHGKITYEDVAATRCQNMLSGNSASHVVVIRPVATDDTVRNLVAYSHVDRLDVVGARFVRHTATIDGTPIRLTNSAGQLNVFGGRFVTNRTTGIVFGDGTFTGAATLTGNSLVLTPGMVAGYRGGFLFTGAGASVVATRNLFVDSHQVLRASGAGATLDADLNVYSPEATEWLLAGSVHTWTSWRALGKDPRSVREATAMVGTVTNGDTAPGASSAAWTIGAGADAWGDAHAEAFISTIP